MLELYVDRMSQPARAILIFCKHASPASPRCGALPTLTQVNLCLHDAEESALFMPNGLLHLVQG